MTWNTPFGSLDLERFPYPGEKSHRAWDASDQWILEHLAGGENAPVFSPAVSPAGTAEAKYRDKISGNWTVIGEDFGALSCAVARFGENPPMFISDSYLAHRALEHNLQKNHVLIPEQQRRSVDSLCAAQRSGPLSDNEGTAGPNVLVKLPRSAAMLRRYLRAALLVARPGSMVYVGGMDKRWSRAMSKTAEQLLGPGLPGRFIRRGRWIAYRPADIPRIDTICTELRSDLSFYSEKNREYHQLSGVFSAGGLDPGAAALLKMIAVFTGDFPNNAKIADLGCGNGILGLETALVLTEAEFTFIDEYQPAVLSAEANWERHMGGRQARFIWSDGLGDFSGESLDAVLCNPPFHHANIQTTETAFSLFSQIRRALKPGGRAVVVSNAHLGYRRRLELEFAEVKELYRDHRFVVFMCQKARE